MGYAFKMELMKLTASSRSYQVCLCMGDKTSTQTSAKSCWVFFNFSSVLQPDLLTLLSLLSEVMQVEVWLCCFCAAVVIYRSLTTVVAYESLVTMQGNLHNSPEQLVCSTVYTKTIPAISLNLSSKCFSESYLFRY